MRLAVNKTVFFACITLLLYLNACATHNNPETQQVVELPELSCVAVLPTSIPTSSSAVMTKSKAMSLEQGAIFFNSVLVEELGTRSEFRVLNENQLDAILQNPWGGRIRQIQDVGAATGCGGVLVTSVSRYRKRVGGEMSVDTPAAAAFSMELVGVKRGIVIWSSSYDEEQKALFDNIFSFHKAESRGFKWLSVEDLVRNSMNLRLAEFPYFQKDEI